MRWIYTVDKVDSNYHMSITIDSHLNKGTQNT